MTNKLYQFLNEPTHISILSTVDDKGIPNSAIFGSTRYVDSQIIIGCGNNRTLTNLRINPNAALMVTIPGKNVLTYQGIRLTLKCCAIEDSGKVLDEMRADVRKSVGATAARMVNYVIRFNICAERRLIDLSAIFET